MTSHHPGSPQVRSLSDTALTVVFGDAVDPEVHGRVMGLARALEAQRAAPELSGVREWIASFTALTVYFDPDETDVALLEATLHRLAGAGTKAILAGRQWNLPACFDEEFAPDIDGVAKLQGLTREAALEIFLGASYRVYTIGFLPGFPYMGGLPSALQVPRLETPRTVVPARSIAIAGSMCAAYPFNSPGGWRLVGRTPLRLFDPTREEAPALLAPGDMVRWVSIDRKHFDALEAEAAAGTLNTLQFMAEHPAAGEAQ